MEKASLPDSSTLPPIVGELVRRRKVPTGGNDKDDGPPSSMMASTRSKMSAGGKFGNEVSMVIPRVASIVPKSAAEAQAAATFVERCQLAAQLQPTWENGTAFSDGTLVRVTTQYQRQRQAVPLPDSTFGEAGEIALADKSSTEKLVKPKGVGASRTRWISFPGPWIEADSMAASVEHTFRILIANVGRTNLRVLTESMEMPHCHTKWSTRLLLAGMVHEIELIAAPADPGQWSGRIDIYLDGEDREEHLLIPVYLCVRKDVLPGAPPVSITRGSKV